MPYSKDVRCGQGWFETNLNCFWTYLEESQEEELITKSDFCESEVKYHDDEMSAQIEERVNEYISWMVFSEKREKLDKDDLLPDSFEDDIWGYVYHHVCMYVRKHPTWYELRSTLPEEEEEDDSNERQIIITKLTELVTELQALEQL